MNKQIEEMKKIVCKACDFICDCEYLMKDEKAYTWCDLPKEVCEALYNAGYYKRSKDDVVMSKEIYLEMCEDFEAMEKKKDNARRETAREILQELYEEADRYVNETVELNTFQIKKLAETYGVEVE